MPEERRGNIPLDFGFAEKNVVSKTYNAGGVVKNQANLPGQKKKPLPTTTTEAPKRIKSPPGRKPTDQKKPITATQKTEAATSSYDHATNTSEIKQEESGDREMQ